MPSVRTLNTGYTGSPRNEVGESMFNETDKPAIPPKTPVHLRKIVKDIIEYNPHLWDMSQVELIMRVARLRHQATKIQQSIDTDGVQIVNRFGEAKPNPMLQALATAHNSVLALERQLGITFVSRGAQVKQAERDRQPRGAPPKKGRPHLA